MKMKECCIKAASNEEEYCPTCGQYLLHFNKIRQLKIKFGGKVR